MAKSRSWRGEGSGMACRKTASGAWGSAIGACSDKRHTRKRVEADRVPRWIVTGSILRQDGFHDNGGLEGKRKGRDSGKRKSEERAVNLGHMITSASGLIGNTRTMTC